MSELKRAAKRERSWACSSGDREEEVELIMCQSEMPRSWRYVSLSKVRKLSEGVQGRSLKVVKRAWVRARASSASCQSVAGAVEVGWVSIVWGFMF